MRRIRHAWMIGPLALMLVLVQAMAAPPRRPKTEGDPAAPAQPDPTKDPAKAKPQAPATPLPPMAEKLVRTYRDLQRYQGSAAYTETLKEGRWTTVRTASYTLSFDRKAQRLALDHPFMHVVSDAKTLRARNVDVAGAHLETSAPTPLDHAGVMAVLSHDDQPMLGEPEVPEMALLLSLQPLSELGDGEAPKDFKDLPAGERAGRKVHRLSFVDGMDRGWVLEIDERTGLLAAATCHPEGHPQPDQAQGDGYVLSYVFTATSDQPLPAAAFNFDTINSKPVKSMAELAAASGDEAPHPLTNKPAPDFKLKDLNGAEVQLSQIKQDVVILDFWATWCGPCREGLPKLQKIHEWAQKEKLSVAVHPINIEEGQAEVKAFWTKAKFTMPTLLDSDSAVSRKYGVEGIPQTVVILKGKVIQVIVGLEEDMENSLKATISQALKADDQAPADEGKPGK